MIQASFNIYPQLLVVQFTDTSVVDEGLTITAWSWDFGDAQTSTTQNPSNTYATPGKYKVTLTVTDSNAGTLQSVRYLMVDIKPILPVTLEELVKLKLPSNFPYQPAQLTAIISTWQFYTQPLINLPGVADSDVLNELAYPPIINALIAFLAAYQIMLDYAASLTLTGSASGLLGEGAIKRIETGPSNAEWMPGYLYLKNLMPFMEELRKQICIMSFRVMIEIPYCPHIRKPVFIPKKASIHRHRNHVIIPINLWSINPCDFILAY